MGVLLLLETCVVSLCHAENPNRIRPLADDFVTVCRSPDPKTVYCYTPGICRLDSGRLVATCDFGGMITFHRVRDFQSLVY